MKARFNQVAGIIYFQTIQKILAERVGNNNNGILRIYSDIGLVRFGIDDCGIAHAGASAGRDGYAQETLFFRAQSVQCMPGWFGNMYCHSYAVSIAG